MGIHSTIFLNHFGLVNEYDTPAYKLNSFILLLVKTESETPVTFRCTKKEKCEVKAGDFETGGKTLWGDFLAIIGSICAAVYLLLGRKLRQKISLMTYIAVCYGSAAVILWTIVLGLNLKITGFEPHTVYALWGIALVPQLIGHTTYNWALKWFPTSFIAISLLGEPIGSTIMAYFLFNEGLTLAKVAGGSLILCGIFIAARRQ